MLPNSSNGVNGNIKYQRYQVLDFHIRNSTPKSSTGSSSEHSMENSMNDSANSSMDSSMDSSTDNSTEISSNTDVIVIKAVVYEIGILTDTDNTTSAESTERQERVDITLYNTPQDDEFS
ncbi:uncharacterized protein LOC143907610 isoform X2 [Temnothorax americanus]|uniref:uncharacterized protein LOC143907610 isoform X2 n=1 Tax=Temnothorax americanus TaxID=1964332 RepID=UPI004069319C